MSWDAVPAEKEDTITKHAYRIGPKKHDLQYVTGAATRGVKRRQSHCKSEGFSSQEKAVSPKKRVRVSRAKAAPKHKAGLDEQAICRGLCHVHPA